MKKPASGRIALGNALVTVETDGMKCGFRIHTAWIEMLPTAKTPVHLHLEGEQGALTLKLPLVRAWSLSAEIHERAIGFRQASERTPSARNPRKSQSTENI